MSRSSLRSDTIAAISTPLAAGGIAVVRISGAGAAETAEKVFVPARGSVRGLAGYRALYGKFTAGGESFDNGMLLMFRAPHSYTGEDVAELSCHGGVYIAKKLLSAVLDAGARPAEPGEFTRRAFENGKLDLTAAESVMALIRASGEAALREANEARQGSLYRKAQEIKEKCIGAAASIAVYLDYPDEDQPPPEDLASRVDGICRELRELASTYDSGRVYREGLKTVILGRPNVGKSALMNLLAGCERSIVTPIEGTTRDVVEETVRVGSVLLRLADTAGIRDTEDPIERKGVELARRELAGAQLALAVFDGAMPLDGRDRRVAALCRDIPAVCVINKSDLPAVLTPADFENEFDTVVTLSALDPGAAQILEKAIVKTVGANPENRGAFNERQRACLTAAAAEAERVREDLAMGMTPDALQIGLEAAAGKLCELTGENVPDEVVDRVFSEFCVGK